MPVADSAQSLARALAPTRKIPAGPNEARPFPGRTPSLDSLRGAPRMKV